MGLSIDSQGRGSRRSPRRDSFIAEVRFAAEFCTKTTDAGTAARAALTTTRRGELDWRLVGKTAEDFLQAGVDLAIDVDKAAGCGGADELKVDPCSVFVHGTLLQRRVGRIRLPLLLEGVKVSQELDVLGGEVLSCGEDEQRLDVVLELVLEGFVVAGDGFGFAGGGAAEGGDVGRGCGDDACGAFGLAAAVNVE